MTTINIDILEEGADTIKHFGNHVFARTADLVRVYEILTYEKHEPKTLKELDTAYMITKNTTWDDLVNRFFGRPTAPDFNKIIKHNNIIGKE